MARSADLVDFLERGVARLLSAGAEGAGHGVLRSGSGDRPSRGGRRNRDDSSRLLSILGCDTPRSTLKIDLGGEDA